MDATSGISLVFGRGERRRLVHRGEVRSPTLHLPCGFGRVGGRHSRDRHRRTRHRWIEASQIVSGPYIIEPPHHRSLQKTSDSPRLKQPSFPTSPNAQYHAPPPLPSLQHNPLSPPTHPPPRLPPPRRHRHLSFRHTPPTHLHHALLPAPNYAPPAPR